MKRTYGLKELIQRSDKRRIIVKAKMKQETRQRLIIRHSSRIKPKKRRKAYINLMRQRDKL